MFKLFDADENTRSAILIDLYFNTLAYATKSGFNTEKSSTWLAIVKAVHEKATGELQTIGNSFEFFKLPDESALVELSCNCKGCCADEL